MNDRPTAEELLRAVERFLEREVVPRLDGVPKFHARVAANVVAMVAREIETADAHERGDCEPREPPQRPVDRGPVASVVAQQHRQVVGQQEP